MGRRSINTTKSGKFMNPTDQARKEARKRELKKNKKQRMMVRQAVLKGKDPTKIIEDMEVIDKMEYNPMEPPKLNEKVLKDKRKKLRETFERVLHMYEKEEPEYSVELRKMYHEYEKRQTQLRIHFEQVISAQRVQLDAIPLPADAPLEFTGLIPLPGDIPLPDLLKGLPKGILKPGQKAETVPVKPAGPVKRKPPGPPPGSPPPLSDSEDDSKEEETVKPAKQRKIRFDDEGTRDPNEEEKDSRTKYKMAAKMLLSDDAPPGTEPLELDKPAGAKGDEAEVDTMEPEIPGVPTGVPPPLFRPLQLRGPPGMLPMRLPPGPPPGRPPMLPPGPPPGMPPNMRMPPRLPPGLPPRMMRPLAIPLPSSAPPTTQSGVLSAPPSIIKPPLRSNQDDSRKGATIQAKAQIRKLGDVTKFTPTALKIRREYKDGKGRLVKPVSERAAGTASVGGTVPKSIVHPQTKDDAYDTFMKEMEDLL